MKKIKIKTTHKSSFFDTKEKIIKALIAAGVIVLIVAVLMLVEIFNGKLIIKNNTDLNLEYVNSSFVTSYEDADAIELKKVDDINANKKYVTEYDEVNLKYTDSNLDIRFKFENHDELFVDAGLFNDKLTGNVTITFKQTKDPNIVKLMVKARNGLLPSNTINCNDEFTIDLNKNEIID